jgi:hypothetical protein
MAGLVPAIHVFLPCETAKDVDARDTSAFTRVFKRAVSAFTRVFDALWRGHDGGIGYGHNSKK